MKEVLVVIDCQPYFVDGIPHKRVEPLITNIQRELRRSISLREWVLLVEYVDCGETDPRIMGCLKHYSRTATISKEDDDGAKEILAKLMIACRPSKLRVAGVNSHACVLKTVRSLAKTLPVQVVADCTDTSAGPKWHRNALSQMKQLANVEVL